MILYKNALIRNVGINVLMPRISHRPKLSFTQEELDYLIKLSRSRNQAASIVKRSKIILLSYQGKNDTEISKELKVDYKTVIYKPD